MLSEHPRVSCGYFYGTVGFTALGSRLVDLEGFDYFLIKIQIQIWGLRMTHTEVMLLLACPTLGVV